MLGVRAEPVGDEVRGNGSGLEIGEMKPGLRRAGAEIRDPGDVAAPKDIAGARHFPAGYV